jgi:glycosyltransferase involved in cell wall biosynthesis
MKVLVIHSELGVLRGGGENFTRNLFTAFAERGHTVKAAFFANRKCNYPYHLPSGIEPIPIPGVLDRNFGQVFFSRLRHYVPFKNRTQAAWDRIQEAFSFRVRRRYDRWFRQKIELKFASTWNDFDAVYVHANLRLASRIAKYRPTILRLPGPVPADAEPMLHSVHAVCANGDALARIRVFLKNRAVELPVGVDTNCFKPQGATHRSDLGWNDQHQVLGYVGRLTHLKGADILADAFRAISRVLPDARLLIVGSGSEESYVRALLAEELGNKIVQIERDVDHNQLPSWYRAMDLFIMPSRYENCSNAILEAMACGVPFLASNVGGNTVLAETGAGWLFDSGSVHSLGSCVQSVLERTSEMKKRGQLGVKYLQSCGSWAASAVRLEDIISSRLGIKT